MKMYRGHRVKLHAFQIFTLQPLYPRERALDTHLIGSWAFLRTDLGTYCMYTTVSAVGITGIHTI
jgi:hypothetical protein